MTDAWEEAVMERLQQKIVDSTAPPQLPQANDPRLWCITGIVIRCSTELQPEISLDRSTAGYPIHVAPLYLVHLTSLSPRDHTLRLSLCAWLAVAPPSTSTTIPSSLCSFCPPLPHSSSLHNIHVCPICLYSPFPLARHTPHHINFALPRPVTHSNTHHSHATPCSNSIS
jgi:hypothetical protein